MLILTRRHGDSILIDGGIRVVVLACDRRGVRLGIEAPPSVRILREELLNRISDEHRPTGTAPEAPNGNGPAAPGSDAQQPQSDKKSKSNGGE